MDSRSQEPSSKCKKLIAETPNTYRSQWERERVLNHILGCSQKKISELPVLMTDREHAKIPVYLYAALYEGPGSQYTTMEKLGVSLAQRKQRLKRYFQAHTVVVITNQPIKQLLSSSEISGRMLKWKFELEGYDIQYRPRTAIKGQILADFIVERPEEESPDELMAEPEVLPEPWTLFTDGSSCVDGSGAGSGYQQKDRKPSQNDKTEHGMEKTVQNQGQSPKMPKSESILKNQQSTGAELKNTINAIFNPSDGELGRGKAHSIFMRLLKTKWGPKSITTSLLCCN
ncbi:hypothetical protein Tco_0573142 [Tanacetum coccineum]